MKILAIDYGDKRLGLAVTDDLSIAAHGVGTVEVKSPAHALKAVSRAIAEHKAEKIVIGLPLNQDGSIGPRARTTLAFVEMCRAKGKTPVETIDESLSSYRSEDAMREGGMSTRKQKKHRDTLAAVIILQDYLTVQEADEKAKDAGE
jgi:putative holliday junction resolvase